MTDAAPSRESLLQVRELTESDHDALVALAQTSTTGTEKFRVDRSRDYFALGRALGETTYQGLFHDGRLVGCLALSEQVRFLSGSPQHVAYVHDVRVHPDCAGRGLFSHFVRDLARAHTGRFAWIFCSILDDNPFGSVVRRTGAMFGTETFLGRCAHVGLPVAHHEGRSSVHVAQVPRDEAWAMYRRLAAPLDMAPADEARFMTMRGEHLAAFQGKELLGCAVWIDQSRERRILVAGDDATLHELPIAYLSHFVTTRFDVTIAQSMASFMAETFPGRHSHIFFGVDPYYARQYAQIGSVHLTSSTFAYGAAPSHLTPHVWELSWI